MRAACTRRAARVGCRVSLPVVLDGRERQGCEGPRVTVTDHHPVQDGESGQERVLHTVNVRSSSFDQPASLLTVSSTVHMTPVLPYHHGVQHRDGAERQHAATPHNRSPP